MRSPWILLLVLLWACDDPAVSSGLTTDDAEALAEDAGSSQSLDGATSTCVPEPEICDGRDNDCDGEIDNPINERCEMADIEPIDAGLIMDAARPVDVGLIIDAARSVDAARSIDAALPVDVALPEDLPPLPPDAEPVCTPEICDGVDNDCDGDIDEDFDADGDGAPVCPSAVCPPGCGADCAEVCARQDCDDDDPNLSPTRAEICGDGLDNDCRGGDMVCDPLGGRMSTLGIASMGDRGCPDLNGDGRPDNSFALAGLAFNGQINDSIRDGILNLIVVALGVEPPGQDGFFELGFFPAQGGPPWSPGAGTLDPDGHPRSRFEAEVSDGALEAGPGLFLFEIQQGGTLISLEISQTWVFGQMDLTDEGLTLTEAKAAGVIAGEALLRAIEVLDEQSQQTFHMLIQPDVDMDGDGAPDGYSACLNFETAPADIINWF